MEIKKITSAQNEYIKMLSKLSSKKNREEAGLFLAEGEHLTEMVLSSAYEVKNIVMTEEYYAKNQDKFLCDIVIVPENIMEKKDFLKHCQELEKHPVVSKLLKC